MRLSLSLDQSDRFPLSDIERLSKSFDGLPLPTSILRILVIQHFYMFAVKYTLKQAACEYLSIPFEHYQLTNPTRRMIGPAKAKS